MSDIMECATAITNITERATVMTYIMALQSEQNERPKENIQKVLE